MFKGYLNYVHNSRNINTVSSVKNIMYSIRSAQILLKLPAGFPTFHVSGIHLWSSIHVYDKVTVPVFQVIRDIIKQLLTNIELDNPSKAG